jgi:hypothetical protein
MATGRLWCRVAMLEPDGSVYAAWTVRGTRAPDFRTVDAIAQLALSARRSGARLQITHATSELRELLALSGLIFEMQRQPEERKEPLRIEQRQEEAHRGDLPV